MLAMNVLVISPWSISNSSIGGTERFVVDLASSLSKCCSVTVLSLGCVDLNIENVKTFSLNIINQLNEQSLLKYLENGGFAEIESKMKSLIKSNKFDIAHCNSLLFSNLIKDIPAIHTVHTNQEEFNNSFSINIANAILRNIENDKNAIYVTPSIFGKESFRALTKKLSSVIPHGFRSDIILRDKLSLKKKYGIPDNDLIFCVPSRLEIQQKGQEIFLGTLRNIERIFPSFSAVLGGCDEHYLENKKYLYKRYPDIRIVIENFINKGDMYSLSDVIILPSRSESFGYAALESAMIGLPLFLSDILSHREIARENPRIFLFDNKEIELARILVEKRNIILDHKIIPPPKKWKERYSEDAMIRKYLFLYGECVSNFKFKM